CRNGGWGSFDKDNTKMIFQYIRFADHNDMLDPPTVDITGRMLEMLATYGYTREDKRVEKAIKFILSEQESDGSWFGGWGETCGSYDNPDTRGVGPSTPSQTAWALLGLLSAGDDRSDSLAKGVRW